MNLNNWQQTSAVSMIVSDGETEQEYRLTFGTCSNYDIGLFNRRRRKAFAYMSETYGDEWLQNDEALVLHPLMVTHAMILAALKKVEVKDGDNWIEAKLTDAWYDAKRFAYEVPAGMIDTLTEAVLEAGNPARLFSYVAIGDEEKKVLRLTVKPLETLPKPS
jgi:hypothetical protein